MKVIIVDGAGFSPPYDFCLAHGLETAGAQVELFLPEDTKRHWRSPDGMPPVPRSGLNKVARRVVRSISYTLDWRRLSSIVAKRKTDVVHVQWLALPLIDGVYLRQLSRSVPVVYTMHNTSLFHGSSGGLQGFGLNEALAIFDRVVVHSRFSQESALRSGTARADQLRVIPHGAFSYYRDYATVQSRPAAPVNLLFAGSIKHYKGLDVLIEALPYLAANTPAGSWTVTVAGSPSMGVSALQQRARDLGVADRIVWSLRHQSERELANLLASCHAVLLPYREIDQSGVLLAAVGTHRPVVASAVGAFPEIVRDGEHGLLVPHSDSTALGAALVRMVLDDDLRTRGEQAMRELAETSLHWTNIASHTTTMYRELLETR